VRTPTVTSVPVFLHFPDGESPLVEMAAVPREGEIVEWSGEPYSEWTVTRVAWTAAPDQPGSVGLYLAPADRADEE
jgi:hypothetical protein